MTSSSQGRSPGAVRPARGSGFLFFLCTGACIAGLVATFIFFVRTTTGQFIDESALSEAVGIHGPAGKVSTQFLDMLPTISLVMAAVVVLALSIIKHRWRAAAIVVAACIGANLATQVLKEFLPARPDVGVVTIALNSMPSGHTTLAASAAAAVFLMVSPRWRPLVGFIGGTYAIITGASTVLNQWHRPADVVAAFLMVGIFMIPAGWLVFRTGPAWNIRQPGSKHFGSAALWTLLPTVLGILAALAAAYALATVGNDATTDGSTNYFWAGTALIVIAGYLSTVTMTALFGYAARPRR